MIVITRICAALTLLAVTAVPAVVAGAAERGGRRLGAAVGPLRLVSTGGVPVDVAGLHSYLGAIELDSANDGLVVVNRLPLESYLLGLDEVPPAWPEEALRAQAVAARTYALYTLSRPRAGAAALYGFDICASVACQVFSGADVVGSEEGTRWAGAVRDTAGEAVTYRGRPILARYHSTSGGRTFANSEGFPGEPDYPYLKPVASTSERASPLYRWTVRFPLRDLQAMLEGAGAWPDGRGTLARVHTIASRHGSPYPDVVLRAPRKHLVLTADELRDAVRESAPEMFPERYPSFALTSSGRLPETLPSERYRIVTRGSTAVVEGRGWGHGVGLSQWGAHGLAAAGETYDAILGHYYSNTAIEELPSAGPIAVGVAWARPKLTATGSFRIVDGTGEVLVPRAIGSWRFEPRGAGTISIDPPRGFGLPLRVGLVETPPQVEAGSTGYLTVALSRPAEVTTAVAGEAPADAVLRGAGRTRIPWRAPSEPGRYEISVRASAGAGERTTEAFEVVVSAGEPAPPRRSRPTSDEGPSLVLVAVVAGLMGLGTVALIGTMRR